MKQAMKAAGIGVVCLAVAPCATTAVAPHEDKEIWAVSSDATVARELASKPR